MKLVELAEGLERLAVKLRELSEQHPDWVAERNLVGELRLADANDFYVGYLDIYGEDLFVVASE